MGVPGRAGGYKPRVAEHIGVLKHQLECAVFRVSPKCLRQSECWLVNPAVLAVGRTEIAVAHEDRLFAASVDGYIFLDEGASVVRIQKSVLGLELESIDSGTGVNGRKAAVRTDNQVRSQSEDPTAAAIAVEVIANQVEVWGQ